MPRRRTKDVVLVEVALFDRLVDACDFLVHHTAGAEVGVTDFGVPHLSAWEAYRKSRGLEISVRVRSKQVVEIRLARPGDRADGRVFGDAVSVQNDEDVSLAVIHKWYQALTRKSGTRRVRSEGRVTNTVSDPSTGQGTCSIP